MNKTKEKAEIVGSEWTALSGGVTMLPLRTPCHAPTKKIRGHSNQAQSASSALMRPAHSPGGSPTTQPIARPIPSTKSTPATIATIVYRLCSVTPLTCKSA